MGYYRRSSYHFYRPRWKGTYRPTRLESSERALNAKQQTTADDDILLILYRMIDDPNFRNRLTILLNAYRRIHGNSAGDYIITALPKWRTGTTKVAQQTIDRLVNLVPRVLTHDERYIVLRKVYQEHRYLLMENHTSRTWAYPATFQIRFSQYQPIFPSAPCPVADILRTAISAGWASLIPCS
jgi:hypothetical protein